jgi:hypothetical protein
MFAAPVPTVVVPPAMVPVLAPISTSIAITVRSRLRAEHDRRCLVDDWRCLVDHRRRVRLICWRRIGLVVDRRGRRIHWSTKIHADTCVRGGCSRCASSGDCH